jgi:hypothetical protein
VQRFLTWIPLGYIFETPLITSLLDRFFMVPMFRVETLECLTEIASLQVMDDGDDDDDGDGDGDDDVLGSVLGECGCCVRVMCVASVVVWRRVVLLVVMAIMMMMMMMMMLMTTLMTVLGAESALRGAARATVSGVPAHAVPAAWSVLVMLMLLLLMMMMMTTMWGCWRGWGDEIG